MHRITAPLLAGLLALAAFSPRPCAAQSFPAPSRGGDAAVADIIGRVSLDSLLLSVNILSGEITIPWNGGTQRIVSRVESANDLAADWLAAALRARGLSVADAPYMGAGRNVVAVQRGTLYPDICYVICAHYDARTDFCADDNASGCGVVLEAARLLAGRDLPFTVIYAFFDEEEVGLLGSAAWTLDAATRGLDIDGVINVDMAGWDGNDDGLCEIHARDVGRSFEIMQLLEDVNIDYGIGLRPVEKVPGTTASDHASFWNHRYGAVLLIEGYQSGDFNPFYHSMADRVSEFNRGYYHRMAKLAIGALLHLAVGQGTLAAETPAVPGPLAVSAYPQPFDGVLTASVRTAGQGRVQVDLFDALGRLVRSASADPSAGTATALLNGGGLAPGTYLLLARQGAHAQAIRVIRR